MTHQMANFMFTDLIVNLNMGVILKDANQYTTFSKNAQLIVDFYSHFFKEESIDIASDLKSMFAGLAQNVTNPQLVVALLKVLSTDFTKES